MERVGSDRHPTYDDLKNMPYLQHTINETLRMYPSVSVNMRMALHDTTLPRGGGPDGLSPVGICKDTMIGYSTIYMQRDPSLFPSPSADFPALTIFCPERWDHWTPKSWHYIPFVSFSANQFPLILSPSFLFTLSSLRSSTLQSVHH